MHEQVIHSLDVAGKETHDAYPLCWCSGARYGKNGKKPALFLPAPRTIADARGELSENPNLALQIDLLAKELKFLLSHYAL
jgi:hypothetical protein